MKKILDGFFIVVIIVFTIISDTVSLLYEVFDTVVFWVANFSRSFLKFSIFIIAPLFSIILIIILSGLTFECMKWY